MYFYSERPGTLAARRYADDIPLEVKKRRLAEIIELQNNISYQSNIRDLGKVFKVLIEGNSKKNANEWMGRNSASKVLVFPKGDYNLQKGDYVHVRVTDCSKGTLIGIVEEHN